MKRFISVLVLAAMVLSTFVTTTNVSASTTYEREEKVLVVLVEFTETTLPRPGCYTYYDGSIKKTDTEYNYLMFGTSGDTLRHYYREVSSEKLDLLPAQETSGTVNDGIVRVKLPYEHPNEYVTTGDSGGSLLTTHVYKVIGDALTEVDKYVDFSLFDNNGDGYIRNPELHLIFMLASSSGQAHKPFIREQYTSLSKALTLDSKSLFAISSIIRFNDLSGFSLNNAESDITVIRHELAHDMNAVDLYKSPGEDVGILSLMAIGRGHLDVYHKRKLGFIDVPIINRSGEYIINSLDLNDPSKYNAILIPLDEPGSYEEFLIIENRQFVGYDSVLSPLNSGGIAIWHVQTYPGWVTGAYDGSPNKIRFEDPDKTYNQDRFYYQGGPDTYGPNTSPANSKSFDGTDTGVSIIVNSPSSSSMSITVKLADEPQNLKATEDSGNINLTWNPVIGAAEYEVSIDNGAFFSVGSNTTYTHAADGKHSYKVRARNRAGGIGVESKTLTVKGIDYGDINGDGAITIVDRDMVSDYLMGISSLTDSQLLAADVDGNGSITQADYYYIDYYITGTVTEFPAGVMKLITYGDIDGDGLITSNDSTLLSDYLLTKTGFTSAQKIASDVDGDGAITSTDLTYIKRYSVGVIKEFPIACIPE